MFYYIMVDGRETVVGVLCDWDLAKFMKVPERDVLVRDLLSSQMSPDEVEKLQNFEQLKESQHTVHNPSGIVGAVEQVEGKQEPRDRTGTGPFMALDLLLYRQPPVHLYRHDLESFFWVLVWFVTTFKPDTHEIGFIREFLQTNLESIGEQKQKYITDAAAREVLDERIDPSYLAVRDTWIYNLHFHLLLPTHNEYARFTSHIVTQLKAAQRIEEQKKLAKRDGVQETENEELTDSDEEYDYREVIIGPGTTEDLMEEVQQLVKKREAIMTFERFMACLKPKA